MQFTWTRLSRPSYQQARNQHRQIYNWCVEQTSFGHICKWDGDMIATPVFEQVSILIKSSEVVWFDGYDVLGKHTTDLEPRIFKYDPVHAKYVDLNFYQALEYDYSNITCMEQKCYVHMKLLKKEWINKPWSHPNFPHTRSVSETGERTASQSLLTTRIRRIPRGLWRRTVGRIRAARDISR